MRVTSPRRESLTYVALDTAEGQPREVFAFAVDGGTIEQVLSESAKAGLKPCAVVYRPLSSVTLLQRLVPQSRRTMVLITLHDREADLSIVRNGHLLYTRTARLVETNNLGDIAAQLAVEVRRSLAAASLTADPEEQHLYVFGAWDDSEQLVQDLADDLALPASLLDPLRSEHVEGTPPANVARLSPLVGMIHEHFERAHPLDFLHPKQAAATAELLSSCGVLCGGRAGARWASAHTTCGMPIRRRPTRSRVSGNRSIVPERQTG